MAEELNQTKPEHAKTFAAEGTVYWLLVSAILLVYLTFAVAAAAGTLYFAFTLVLGIVESSSRVCLLDPEKMGIPGFNPHRHRCLWSSLWNSLQPGWRSITSPPTPNDI